MRIFFSSDSEIDISISAIVGENGSGKSSLIELLYYMVYFIGIRSKKRIKQQENLIEINEEKIQEEQDAIRSYIELRSPVSFS